ncbi:MAG TPA: phosphoesterase [Citreicella sp.]|nr:phosphoesterase [Citreicella sp.]
MDAFPRRAVVDQALGSLFAIDLADSAAANAVGHLTLRGQTLVTLHKPDDALLVRSQLPHLRAAADLRMDRLAEIQVQTSDILSFFGMLGYMHPEATKWTHWFAGAVLRLCTLLEMPLKLGFDVARPITLAYEVQPIIQTPGHGAWPSGHATEAFAVATLLLRLFTEGPFDPKAALAAGSPFYRHAARIAANRTVAGVHYPTDSMAGAVLGLTLAEALVRLLDGALADPVAEVQTASRTYRGDTYEGDFTLGRLAAELAAGQHVTETAIALDPVLVPVWMREMWRSALTEG